MTATWPRVRTTYYPGQRFPSRVQREVAIDRGCALRWHDPCYSVVVRKRLSGRGRFVQGEVQDVLRGGARAPRYRDSGGGVFCMRRLPDYGQRTRAHGYRYITGRCLM